MKRLLAKVGAALIVLAGILMAVARVIRSGRAQRSYREAAARVDAVRDREVELVEAVRAAEQVASDQQRRADQEIDSIDLWHEIGRGERRP